MELFELTGKPLFNRLSAVKNLVGIINLVHRIKPEEIQPATIAV